MYDAISYKNRQWELQHAPYVKYGYDVFWDTFKFDDDILVILTPLTLLVGLVQMIVPALFCCLKTKVCTMVKKLRCNVHYVIDICNEVSLYYRIWEKRYNFGLEQMPCLFLWRCLVSCWEWFIGLTRLEWKHFIMMGDKVTLTSVVGGPMVKVKPILEFLVVMLFCCYVSLFGW